MENIKIHDSYYDILKNIRVKKDNIIQLCNDIEQYNKDVHNVISIFVQRNCCICEYHDVGDNANGNNRYACKHPKYIEKVGKDHCYHQFIGIWVDMEDYFGYFIRSDTNTCRFLTLKKDAILI